MLTTGNEDPELEPSVSLPVRAMRQRGLIVAHSKPRMRGLQSKLGEALRSKLQPLVLSASKGSKGQVAVLLGSWLAQQAGRAAAAVLRRMHKRVLET